MIPVTAIRSDRPTWEGTVRVERPHNPTPQSMCRIISARLLCLNGARMVGAKVPYAAVRMHFRAGDLDYITLHAEVRHGALILRERAKPVDFFHHPVLN
jgi:hypothetical protein